MPSYLAFGMIALIVIVSFAAAPRKRYAGENADYNIAERAS